MRVFREGVYRHRFSLIFSTLKMAVATFSSRILGLVREQVMAAIFGASGITDAFSIAYRIPNMLRDLFAEGAFSSAFVPVFIKTRHESEKSSRTLLWSMVLILSAITGVIALSIIIWAPDLVRLMTDAKFVADEKRFQVCVQMVRVMAPFLTLISLAALFMGALNSLKIFFIPSFAPVLFNVMMIFSMLTLPSFLLGHGIHPIMALAFGVMGGGLLQMLFQFPLLLKKGLTPTGEWEFFGTHTRSILGRLGVGTIGVAATQINILITTFLATSTQLGAVSWLGYAFRLFQFPVGILSVSIGGANLVHFSEAWKGGKKEEAIKVLKASYIFSWFLILPAFILMMGLSHEIVHLIFERGQFSSYDTEQSTLALQQYLWGLPFYGLYKVFAPTFFSIDRPKVPVFISIFSIALNILFCFIFVPRYGFSILALGTSLYMMLNCSLQCLFLHKYLGLGVRFFISRRLLKFLLAALLTWPILSYVHPLFYIFSHSLFWRMGGFLLSSLIGALSYFFFVLLFGEGREVKKVLSKKV